MGSFSCINVPLIVANSVVHCRGFHSCRGSTIQNDATVLCYAASSCAETTIKEETYYGSTVYGVFIYCYGKFSCAKANISGNDDIQATGSYSLYGSTVYSNGTDIDVDISGYFAGYNLTIVCSSGDSCAVECFDNACVETYFYCDDSVSTCTVDCNSTSGSCPYQISSTASITQLSSWMDVAANEEDKNCNNSLATDCSEWKTNAACYNNGTLTETDGSICCRGELSCGGDTSMAVSGTNNSIWCDGEEGCYDGTYFKTLSSKYDIYCGGMRSCTQNYLIAINDIHCGALTACLQSTIKNAQNLYCDSYYACQSTTIINVTNIYSTAESGMLSADIYSNGSDTNLYLQSWRAGQTVDFHCAEGDTCYLSCETHGACRSSFGVTTLYCAGNCVYYCEPQLSIQCPDVVNEGSGDARRQTIAPTVSPTFMPTLPTAMPSYVPTFEPTPETTAPSGAPSIAPSTAPTFTPSVPPSNAPSLSPTAEPTDDPSRSPTGLPSITPTSMPTNIPTAPTGSPSEYPTESPTEPFSWLYNFSVLVGTPAEDNDDEYTVLLQGSSDTWEIVTISNLTNGDQWYNYSILELWFGSIQKLRMSTEVEDSTLGISFVKIHSVNCTFFFLL